MHMSRTQAFAHTHTHTHTLLQSQNNDMEHQARLYAEEQLAELTAQMAAVQDNVSCAR